MDENSLLLLLLRFCLRVRRDDANEQQFRLSPENQRQTLRIAVPPSTGYLPEIPVGRWGV